MLDRRGPHPASAVLFDPIGGPLVRADRTVVGRVFAHSSLNDDIGYALTSDEVRPDLATAEPRTAAVSTGPRTAG